MNGLKRHARRARVALLTTAIVAGLYGLFVLFLFVATHVSILGPSNPNGASYFSVILGIYLSLAATAVLAAYVAIGIAERPNGIWKTKLWRPLSAKALAIMFVTGFTGFSSLDLFIHDLSSHWLRVVVDPEVRLGQQVTLIGLILCFVWQLAALVSSFGWVPRAVARLVAALIFGPAAGLAVIYVLSHANVI